ncbi:hypothetical protein vBSsoS008_083 [Shigella phage vB_SsoS_008]|nr:hypothetical protein vBSsoS008_083 [Shigella phage vB_SsoS_008]
MDCSSGFISMTVTKTQNGNNVIGSTPGSRLINATDADVRATLEANSIYINSWSYQMEQDNFCTRYFAALDAGLSAEWCIKVAYKEITLDDAYGNMDMD